MPKSTEEALLQGDAGLDLNKQCGAAGLIDALQAGKLDLVTIVLGDQVIESIVTRARLAAKLSQVRFASLMSISKRTLQDLEQGRRQPRGAGKSLLRVAERHPEVLRDLGAQ
jgi:DNA-binding transcriptional regulator YiaG